MNTLSQKVLFVKKQPIFRGCGIMEGVSYHIYQTSGFILRSINVGEADRIVFVFTEQLGLLPLSVRAARKSSSKLRYALKNYSFVRVAFVRGKHAWRLTDAEEKLSFHPSHDAKKKLKILAGTFALVSRLVHGEGENKILFFSLQEMFFFLQNEDLSEEESGALEILSSCRILASLGYAPEDSGIAPFLSGALSKTLLGDFEPYRENASREVIRALEASQL